MYNMSGQGHLSISGFPGVKISQPNWLLDHFFYGQILYSTVYTHVMLRERHIRTIHTQAAVQVVVFEVLLSKLCGVNLVPAQQSSIDKQHSFHQVTITYQQYSSHFCQFGDQYDQTIARSHWIVIHVNGNLATIWGTTICVLVQDLYGYGSMLSQTL